MSKKTKEICTVVSQECIGTDIYSLWIQTEEIASEAVPGQFVSLYCKDQSKLLPRPISLCQIDREKGRLRLVYRVTGQGTGTEEFSRLQPGDTIPVLGPLGNGFPLGEAKGKKVLLMGGGIGIPPMLQTAKETEADVTAVLGYRDQLFLDKEFQDYGKVYVATEDGSAGTKGYCQRRAACSRCDLCLWTKPMLRAIKAYALEHQIPCWISMEERMACGVGACLGCVCQSTEVDDHSHVHNKRVCKDGPVFLSTEVEL